MSKEQLPSTPAAPTATTAPASTSLTPISAALAAVLSATPPRSPAGDDNVVNPGFLAGLPSSPGADTMRLDSPTGSSVGAGGSVASPSLATPSPAPAATIRFTDALRAEGMIGDENLVGRIAGIKRKLEGGYATRSVAARFTETTGASR